LSIIINQSFQSGIFPDLFKIAEVVPIFKGGCKQDLCNFRPISLLSNIGKLIEKLMYNRLISFLNLSNSLYSLQFGFRKNHSTNQALIDITETIREALDQKQFAGGVFVDLQKAFDTVDHEILLSKLYHYGVRGIALNWFKSYLNHRTQTVTISNISSSIKLMSIGIPQGSTLGPLLFLI
jgi:hypothetical protein